MNLVKRFLIMLNNLQRMHLKTSSKIVIQKTKEATGDLIGNKNYNYRITKFAKALQQNYSETVANEHGKEIPKVR